MGGGGFVSYELSYDLWTIIIYPTGCFSFPPGLIK